MEFSSAGFDLDALDPVVVDTNNAAQQQEEVVYELGGGVSRISLEQKEQKEDKPATKQPAAEAAVDDNGAMKKADEFKEQGNDAFRDKKWLEAYDRYTLAMEATPGELKGQDLLKLRDEFNVKQNKLARIALQQQEQARRRNKEQQRHEQQKATASNETTTTTTSDSTGTTTTTTIPNGKDETAEQEPAAVPREEFKAPPHAHGEKLSIYYCNRSACLLQLERYEEALDDCDIALLWNPTYTKALVRRSKIHELLGDEHLDAALKDAQHALQLEPHNKQYKATVKRLEQANKLYMERLKVETMDKLKDLGNSILGNFGLSLDNFQTVQDPNTGSYSISFDQSNKK